MKVVFHWECPLLAISGDEFDKIRKENPDVVGCPVYWRFDSSPPEVWPNPSPGYEVVAD